MGIENCGIDDVWVGHFESRKVRIEGVAYEDGARVENCEEFLLDIFEGRGDRSEHFFCDTRISKNG